MYVKIMSSDDASDTIKHLLYACMYVCMYICMYVCMCLNKEVFLQVLCVRLRGCVCVYIYRGVYILVYMYICMHAWLRDVFFI